MTPTPPQPPAAPPPNLDAAGPRETGIVQRIRPDLGFGFVRDAKGIERFFHESAVIPRTDFHAITEGTTLTFAPGMHPKKGPRAELVSIVREPGRG